MALYEDPAKVYSLTIKRNMIAVVTDGSAVLGLGNIGPQAALPVTVESWEGEPPRILWSIRAVETNWGNIPEYSSVPACPTVSPSTVSAYFP
ncbi:hypothetical protein Back11_15930 [Paenibacillus baekrokdamisoli]|uniref:Uncharacterized protein n=1 Tax=Paenibacillus baekrokdamisoli TaxID=1712516 RepID=A0A3G9J8S3_9BACL|nr:hypothetical protein [Paenibacillus baekrokdamisoli]MBB3073454.1 hypothetical protein [Paenibacillus baekrokdamisoli]BBH20248.1 hypothetical protein Back11_15930 [Paenibacillus baekrokdamisoli]